MNSYIPDVTKEKLSRLVSEKKLVVTSDYKVLKKADIVSICVPTPSRKTREPDISCIISDASEISNICSKVKREDQKDFPI